MRVTLQPADELRRLQEKSAQDFADAILGIAKAAVEGKPRQDAVGELRRLLWQTMTHADLLARKRVRLYKRNLEGNARFASSATPVMPKVPFKEAVADLVSREPILADKVDDIAEIYARHGFSLAKAAELETVKKVQEFLATAAQHGTTADRASWVLESMGDWSRAYADTVYRTNLSNAYAAGTFREAMDPDVAQVIGALEFDDVGDSDTRPNHHAAEGLVAAPDDPVWDRLAPPLGYRCRCFLRFVDRLELEQRGLIGRDGRVRRATIPPGAHADPGFRVTRPDRAIYGG